MDAHEAEGRRAALEELRGLDGRARMGRLMAVLRPQKPEQSAAPPAPAEGPDLLTRLQALRTTEGG
jgi:hypothetical protein